MFEQAVIQSLCKRQDTGALSRDDINRHHIQRVDVFKGEISRPDLPLLFPLSA
ncbi:hypothetical protein D3C87_2088110 [compost metagenome]